MNAILKYPGGKWRLGNWITSFFPKHKVYLEPFSGSAAVFFAKTPAAYETINDLDGRIYNFFKVCRERPKELAALLELTPYARREFESVQEDRAGAPLNLTGDPVEDARRFCVRCHQGFGNKLADRVGWRNTKSSSGPVNPIAWAKLPRVVIEVAERLKETQIENRPAGKLIEKYNAKDCLIYADPPYLMNTRGSRIYTHEMGGEKEHEALLDLLKRHKGPVVLSGYDNDLYNEILHDWHTETKQTTANNAAIRIEKLWMNFSPPSLLWRMDEA